MTPVSMQNRGIVDGAVNTLQLNEQSLMDNLAGEAARRGIIVVGGKTLDARPSLLDGRLDLSRVQSDVRLGRPSIDLGRFFPKATDNVRNDPQLQGLAKEVEQVNGEIDKLLADYQKALDAGEDTFVIQTKIQQAMQRRLELITLLSNLQKMQHDSNMAIINNIR